jgi:diguanylate cyclase (GGDEF)-like protein
MNELKVGSLIVMDYGVTVGIITSRDIRSVHPNRIVADAMTMNPVRISQDEFAWDALDMMEESQIERLLVQDGDQVTGTITKDRLLIKLGQLIDPLTGLYRAPYIQQIGEHLLKQFRYFQLFFIDINGFGEINKVHGHPFGDDIIIEFSKRLQLLSGEEDYVCRYAGDEFVMITCRLEEDSAPILKTLSQPSEIHNVQVSAAVGVVNPGIVPDFYSLPFRDLMSKASLISTSLKKKTVSN